MTTRSLLYVIIQLLLFLVFAAIPGGRAEHFGWQLTAFALVVSGILIVAVAMIHLGPGFTPMPVPRIQGKLITTGLYKYVRHPIYSGILLITLGITSYSLNLPRLITTLLLLLLFYFKSKYEEELLALKYPDYLDYRKHTGRFIPKFKHFGKSS